MTHVVRKPKFFNSYCLICLAQAWQQNMNLEAFHTAMVLFETIITCTWLRISYQNTLALERLALHVMHDPVRLFLEFAVPQMTQTRHPASARCFGCRMLRLVVSKTSHARHLGMSSGTTDLQFQHGPICVQKTHFTTSMSKSQLLLAIFT